jgi:uncharacterized protein involved in exopolysaccharide biosynthesis
MDAMSTTQATELDALRRRRAELRESMGRLESALSAAASGRAMAWGERVHEALHGLADDWGEHVVVTEGPGGLHEAILSASVRLANGVRALADEHALIAADIASAVVATEPPVAEEDVAEIRERATALLGRLTRHRQRGADLIYDAYALDLGAGD